MKTNLALAIALFATPAVPDDVIPGPPQKQPIALVGGTVHTVSGGTIENGVVVFERGRITAVGVDAPIPEKAKRVDVTGKPRLPRFV